MSDWKVYQYLAEVLVATDGDILLTQGIVEYIQDSVTADARLTQSIVEYIQNQVNRKLRLTQVIIEIIVKNTHVSGNAGDYLDEAAGGNFAW